MFVSLNVAVCSGPLPVAVGSAAVCVSLTVTWTVFSDADESEAAELAAVLIKVEEAVIELS